MLALLVTSPHAKCKDGKERTCDLAANNAATIFCMQCGRFPALDPLYLQGNEYRTDYDLNRTVSRTTPYRLELESYMKKVNYPCIVVDVHSFPNFYMQEAGDINFFKPDETPPDVVLLSGPSDNYHGFSLSHSICDALHEAGLKCKVLDGITVNDIMNQSNKYGISSVLIEFNEKLNRDPMLMHYICYIIAQTFSALSKE